MESGRGRSAAGIPGKSGLVSRRHSAKPSHSVSDSAQGWQFDGHLTLGFHMGQSSNLVRVTVLGLGQIHCS